MAMSEAHGDLQALPPAMLLLGTDAGLRLHQGLPTAPTEEEEARLGDFDLAPAPAMTEPMELGILHVAESGDLLACADADHVWVQRTRSAEPEVAFRVENPRTMALAFSPRRTYLLAWQRWDQADTSGAAHGGNLKVFRVADGAIVADYMQRQRKAEAWPSIQWSADEAYCVRLVSNEVRLEHGLFEEGPRPDPVTRIRLERVQGFAVAPGEGYPLKVATYVPEAKGGSPPPRVAVWHWSPSDTAETMTPIAVGTKTLTRAEDVEFVWSPTGSAVLVKTSSSVDHSGESYYGGTGLFLIAGDGSFDCIVMPPKPGKIEDCSWSPSGREFVLVAGTQPARATLFDLKAEGIFDFGQAHRNTALWAPHGRFLMLGGFGNLVGEMTFWDRNKLKAMGETIVAPTPATTYGWAPDSRYFLTATTRPRMNVENSVHIFRYNGDGPLVSKSFEYLTLAQWLPGVGAYPDRPQSPRRIKRKKKEGQEAKAAPAAAPSAYVPPSQRGQGGVTSAVAEKLRAEHDSGGAKKLQGVGAYRPPGARGPGGGIPGMPVGAPVPTAEPMSKAAKARARKKKKQEEKQQAEELAAKVAAAQPSASEAAEAAPEAAGPGDPAKKLKKLRKKLQQIEALKARAAAGEDLDADQRRKLSTEAEIIEDIQALLGA